MALEETRFFEDAESTDDKYEFWRWALVEYLDGPRLTNTEFSEVWRELSD